jgi:hypothetical protein
MRRTDYDRFTQTLSGRLRDDARVVGLVAVGSMADRDYAPDEWSDHDFFVVTRPGAQEELRRDLSWLPREDEVALAFQETDHGLKVLYDDGHLLEFAVFDLEEVGLARINRYRVLLDRGGVTERTDEVARTTGETPAAADTAEIAFGMFVTNVLVGAGRHRRGERLSGSLFVKSLSVRWLRELLHSLPGERSGLLDDLDPFRRFELVHPALAAEVEALLARETLAAASGLLDLAERELRPGFPELPWDALAVVRRRLAGAC